MQDRGIECAYAPCNCVVVGPEIGGEAYCGDFCRSAEERSNESEMCACGHPPCDTA